MKRYIRLVLMIGSIGWFLNAAASDDFALSLGTCPNGLPQPFTTTAHNSTQITGSNTAWKFYSSTSSCSGSGTIKFTASGTLNLPNSGVFMQCSSGAPNSLGAIACLLHGNNSTLQLVFVNTDTGNWSVTGSCYQVTCSGASFTSWAVLQSHTISL